MIRLQKYIADCGICSRRKAEELITNGEISVNGEAVNVLGIKIDPTRDRVEYGGKVLKPCEEYVYIMLHKPEGYVTTVKDQFSRPTVLNLLADVDKRLFPVGRLDYDTSGLLLLTNDGELTYKLTHPKHNIDKVYIARVKGVPTEQDLEILREGIEIDGFKTTAAGAELIKQDGAYSSLKITIHEGRNRQVRKMCEAINRPVASLKRVATGKVFLGALEKGAYRRLTKREIEYLKGI